MNYHENANIIDLKKCDFNTADSDDGIFQIYVNTMATPPYTRNICMALTKVYL